MDGNSGIKTCRLCSSEGRPIRKYAAKTGNSTLIHHIKQIHRNIEVDVVKSEFGKTVVSQVISKPPAIPITERKEKIHNSIRDLIITGKFPTQIVEDETFKVLCKSLNEDFELPTKDKILTDIEFHYNSSYERILKILQSIDSKISLSIDRWSTELNRNYFIIQANWITKEWTLKSAILEFSYHPLPHDISNTVDIILSTIKNYEIEKKVIAITMNDSKEVESDLSIVKQKLNEEFGTEITYDWRVTCVSYMTNLAIQNTLKTVNSSVDYLRKLITTIQLNEKLKKRFYEIQISMEVPILCDVPLLDETNAWNETQKMIENCYELRETFQELIKSERLENLKINQDTFWSELKSMARFLDIFFEITQETTISAVPLIYDILIDHCEKTRTDEKLQQARDAVQSLKSEIEKFEENFCAFLPSLALALDPRMSTKHPRTASRDRMRWFLVEKYNFKPNTDSSSENSPSNLNFVFQQARKLNSSLQRKDEVDDFYSCMEVGNEGFNDPLKWWASVGCKRFPTISKLAKDVFSILGSTVASDYKFSLRNGFIAPCIEEISENQMKLRSWKPLLESKEYKNI